MRTNAKLSRFGFLCALTTCLVASTYPAGGHPTLSQKIVYLKASTSVELADGWRLVRTPNPDGGPDAVSVMHSADVSRSDLNLAGLMIRCNRGGPQILIVLLEPLPFRVRPTVTLETFGQPLQFSTRVVPPGTAVLLPEDAEYLLKGAWRSQERLSISVAAPESVIRGEIVLKGIGDALEHLLLSCPPETRAER